MLSLSSFCSPGKTLHLCAAAGPGQHPQGRTQLTSRQSVVAAQQVKWAKVECSKINEMNEWNLTEYSFAQSSRYIRLVCKHCAEQAQSCSREGVDAASHRAGQILQPFPVFYLWVRVYVDVGINATFSTCVQNVPFCKLFLSQEK